ncbi:MAG: hypothetical protein IKW08_06750 [Roseburia sp.]|nr:hypothetical protein [Roseburia sp.]
MIINIIMLIAMYPMMMAVCYFMYNIMKPKNGLAFGCTISAVRMKDETLKEIERQWEAEMKRNMVITALLPFTAFFVPYVSIQITIWTLWTFVLIVLLEWPFIKANAKVKDVKRGMGWYDKENPEEFIELKAAGEVRRVKMGTFMVPTLVSMLAVVLVYGLAFVENDLVKQVGYVKDFALIILMLAFLNVLFLWVAQWMDRQKTEVISTQSDVNINYARAKKNIWKDFWLQSSWVTTVYVWVGAITLIFYDWFDFAILAGCVVYTFVVMVLFIPVMRKIREVETCYEKERDIVVAGDDDRYWICGLLYNNPKDKHTMVSQRVGMGTTINIATKAGKVWWAVTVIVMLSLPILLGWLIFEEFTPISLSINEDELHANHLKLEYELPIEEIENLELVDALPKTTKVVGSAMDSLVKGTYRIKGTGEKCILFLNPENEKFLRFEVDGQVYYMSGFDDEETAQVYEAIK